MLLLDTSFLVDLAAEYAAKKIGPARRFVVSRPGTPVCVSVIALGEFAEGYEDKADVERFMAPFKVLAFSRAIVYKGAAVQRAFNPKTAIERKQKSIVSF